MTGLEKITAKIISDAEAEADKTVKAAVAESQRIEREYQEKAKTARDDMISYAESEASNRVARIKSAMALEQRNVTLAAKSELIDEAFELARKDIAGMSDKKYIELISGILTSVMLGQSKAVEAELRDYGDAELEAVDKYEVVFNESDREKYGAAIVDAAKINITGRNGKTYAEKLVLSEKTADIDGGFILAYGDVSVNCSISMLLSNLRSSCEGIVYKTLFKE